MVSRRGSILIAATLAAAILATTGSTAPPTAVIAEPGNACRVSDTGRFTDCASGFYSWNIRQTNGEILGTVDISFTISETVSSDSRTWSAHWAVFVMNLTGVAEAGTTMAVVPECGGSCSAGTGLPDSGAALSRNQTVAGDVSFSAQGPGPDTSTQTINIYLFNAAAQTPGTTYGDPRTTLGHVRCDDGVPSEEDTPSPPRPGCVVADHVPTFVLNSPEFPDIPAPLHAAFVAAAQQNPRTMAYGRPGANRPLIREILNNRAAKNAKRKLVCGREFKRYPSPPGTPTGDRDSCDEYPYSSTFQGTPQFAVTEHVPQGDNNNAGDQLNKFYYRYRIGHGDGFYVQP